MRIRSFATAREAHWTRSRRPAALVLAALGLLSTVGAVAAVSAHKRPDTAEQDGTWTIDVYPDQQASAVSEIQQTLAGWARAAASNNVHKESGFYAPAVKRYFLQRNVSNAFVQRDKQALRERGSALERFTIENVDITFESPIGATVSLVKSWVMTQSSGARRVESTHSRLWLARTPAGWKITGEQDLRPVHVASVE